MHALPHLCAHSGFRLPDAAAAPLLCHPYLLSGADLHLQAPAGGQAHPGVHVEAQVDALLLIMLCQEGTDPLDDASPG